MSIAGEALNALLEQEYERQRKESAEGLHNEIVEIINQRQPSVETVLYVLEMLKLNLLQRELHGPSPGAVLPAKAVAVEGAGWRAEREKRQDGSRVQTDPT